MHNGGVVNKDFLAPIEPRMPEPEVCITCGDVAVAVTVVALDPDGVAAMARVRAEDGGEETIDVSLVSGLAVGDTVLAHARTAIARL